MQKFKLVLPLLSLTICITAAHADDRKTERFSATLTPTQEVQTVSSVAIGHFSAVIDEEAQTITYEETYDGLEGTVTQSHIHFGAPATTGGVSLWLCGTAAMPGPAGTPACPAPGGTVTGVLTAAQVVGPAAQGIAAGEFAEIVAAIRSGNAYANVHSTKFGGGEIRGVIRRGNGHDHD